MGKLKDRLTNDWNTMWQKDNLGGTITGLVGGLGSAVGAGITNAKIQDTSDDEAFIEDVGNQQFGSSSTDNLMASFDAVNGMARTNYTGDELKALSTGQHLANLGLSTLGGFAQGAGSGNLVEGLIGAGINAIGSGIGWLTEKPRLQKKANELNRLAEDANKQYLNNFANAASNTQNKMFNSSLLNIAAYGGLLDNDEKEIDWDNTLPGQLINYTENRDSLGFDPSTRRWYESGKKGTDPNNRGMGLDINYLKDPSILKKDSKGREYITEADERSARYEKLNEVENSYNQRLKYAQKVTGVNTTPSEYKKALVMDAIYNFGAGDVANVLFEDRVLMNALMKGSDEQFKKEIQKYWDANSGKAIKKRADRINKQNEFFEMNNKAYGGPLFNHSGDWSNGLTFINEGGLHEDNPLGGIPVGVDPEGTPNLVEEGEIIWNDYVFSNRLKPTKKQLETVGYNNKYDNWTFAKIVEDVQKISAETPIDKISTDTLNDNLMQLVAMQEEIRMKKEKKEANKFPDGGGLYDGIFAVYGNNGKPIYLPSAEGLIKKHNLDKNVPIEEVQTQDMLIEDNDIDIPEFDWSVFDNITPTKSSNNSKLPWQSALRYASPLVHGLTLLNNLQKPDYSDEKALMKRANNVTRGSYTPLGNTLDLDLVDRNVYTNPILASASATRRAIMQNSTNAGSANAALLANNYLTNTALGAADIQGIQANNTIKSQKAQFDLTRDQANSQMGLEALTMDQQADQLGLSTMAEAIQSMNAKNTMRNQAISSSLTGLTSDLGAIGNEYIDRAQFNNMIAQGIIPPGYTDIWTIRNNKSTTETTDGKNGGLLTRNRRRK